MKYNVLVFHSVSINESADEDETDLAVVVHFYLLAVVSKVFNVIIPQYLHVLEHLGLLH